MTWDPAQYLRFDDHRLRPALDLLAGLPRIAPREVWDLGCGTGHLTRTLHERWPEATVHGLDSSSEMLGRARKHTGIEWVLGDIATWRPSGPIDLLFSNAALHWLRDHDELMPRLVATLASGGVLAVQMPRNHTEPSHRILYELARSPRWRDRIGHLVVERPVADPEHYRTLLAPLTETLDIWETTYHHALLGTDAVAEWTRGSVMRPYLAALDDEADTFFAEYADAVRGAYPPRPDGVTLFAFRRLFIVATR